MPSPTPESDDSRVASTSMAPPPNLRSTARRIFDRMDREHALTRFQTASRVQEQLIPLSSELAGIKRRAIRELREQGMSMAEMGRKWGISTSRVKQIEQGDEAPKRPRKRVRVTAEAVE